MANANNHINVHTYTCIWYLSVWVNVCVCELGKILSKAEDGFKNDRSPAFAFISAYNVTYIRTMYAIQQQKCIRLYFNVTPYTFCCCLNFVE